MLLLFNVSINKDHMLNKSIQTLFSKEKIYNGKYKIIEANMPKKFISYFKISF